MRWRPSRLPSIGLIEKEDLIAGRASTSDFLDIDLLAASGRSDDMALDIGFRPACRAKADGAELPWRLIRMKAGNLRRPAMVDTAFSQVMAVVLPHRRRDHRPALASAAANRFAPEFAPARQLLARELACRKHFRQAVEQAEFGRALSTPMPADAAMRLDAQTAAFARTQTDRALALPARLSQVRPKRSGATRGEVVDRGHRVAWQPRSVPMQAMKS